MQSCLRHPCWLRTKWGVETDPSPGDPVWALCANSCWQPDSAWGWNRLPFPGRKQYELISGTPPSPCLGSIYSQGSGGMGPELAKPLTWQSRTHCPSCRGKSWAMFEDLHMYHLSLPSGTGHWLRCLLLVVQIPKELWRMGGK